MPLSGRHVARDFHYHFCPYQRITYYCASSLDIYQSITLLFELMDAFCQGIPASLSVAKSFCKDVVNIVSQPKVPRIEFYSTSTIGEVNDVAYYLQKTIRITWLSLRLSMKRRNTWKQGERHSKHLFSHLLHGKQGPPETDSIVEERIWKCA